MIKDVNYYGLFLIEFKSYNLFLILGRNAVTIPIKGKNAQMLNTCSILVTSASEPKIAEPIPPKPNDKPNKSPDTNPILFGMSSVANTTMAENAEDKTKPTQIAITIVNVNPICGSNKVNGAAPRIETHMMSFRPYLSPKGPPIIVPIATETKKAKRYN